MKGVQIFVHSVAIVLRNLVPALRISGLIYFIMMAVQLWFFNSYGNVLASDITGNGDVGVMVPPPGFFSSYLLMLVVSIVGGLWIAVAWHRYVLEEEISGGPIPYWRGAQIGRYFGRSILLGLIIGVPITMVLSIVMGMAAMSANVVVPTAIGVVVLFFGVYLFYRLCSILPAAALNRPLTMGESWRATEGAGGPIVVLVIIALVGAAILQLPGLVFGGNETFLGLIWTVISGWLTLMISASTLTTFYGHYIEGRELM